MKEADEDMVKRLAGIVGPYSAAQKAIDKGAEYIRRGWSVRYWFSDDNHIVVEGVAPEKVATPCDWCNGDSMICLYTPLRTCQLAQQFAASSSHTEEKK